MIILIFIKLLCFTFVTQKLKTDQILGTDVKNLKRQNARCVTNKPALSVRPSLIWQSINFEIMPNTGNTAVKMEDMSNTNGHAKDDDHLVEINGHYMVKRADDTWRKFYVGDNRGFQVFLIEDSFCFPALVVA